MTSDEAADEWEARYRAESKRILAAEIAWQNAEIAKGSPLGLAIEEARKRLGTGPAPTG